MNEMDEIVARIFSNLPRSVLKACPTREDRLREESLSAAFNVEFSDMSGNEAFYAAIRIECPAPKSIDEISAAARAWMGMQTT